MTPPIGAARAGLRSRVGATPGSALYQYQLVERSNSTIIEQLTGANATAVGVTNVSGSWTAGYAESGDGVDDRIEFPSELGTWLESSQNKWFAVTVQADPANLESFNTLFGFSDTDQNPNEDYFVDDPDGDGTINWRVAGSDGSVDQVVSDNPVLDGTKKRLVFQRAGPDANSMEIYANATQISTTVDSAQGFNGSFDSTQINPFGLSRNDSRTFAKQMQATVDNWIFGQQGTTLTASEIADDYQNQPWS